MARKSTLSLLFIGMLMVGFTVFAATLPGDPPKIPSNTDTFLTTIGKDNATYDKNGPLNLGPPVSNTANGILDSDEFALMSCIGNTAGNSHAAAVNAAWTTNINQLATDITNVLGAVAAAMYGPPVAATLTLGDNDSVTAAKAFLATYGVVINLANYNVTLGGLLGPNGDADGDGLTNKAEYDAIAGVGGPSSAKRTQYLINALTPAAPPALTVSISGAGTKTVGESVTLTAVVSGGTTPYTTYLWKKGVTTVGSNSPTLSFSSVAFSDAGSYTVAVTDSAPTTVTSSAASLNVDPVPLSTMGYAGIALLVLLCAAAGTTRIRKMALHH